MPMNIFTYLNKQKHTQVIKFLEKELSDLDDFENFSSDLSSNKYLMDYSKSLFIISN